MQSWPSRITSGRAMWRELRNVIERAVILCTTERIGVEHVPSNFANVPAEPKIGDPVSAIRSRRSTSVG